MTRSCCAVACCGAALVLLSNGVNGEERKDSGPRVKFEIRLAEKEPAEGLEEMVAPKTEVKIYVRKPAAVSNADIAEARAVKNILQQPAVEVVFVKASRKRIAEFSKGNIGKIAAIFIDGKLVSAPVIRADFSEKTEIWGDFTQKEAERIAKGIKAE